MHISRRTLIAALGASLIGSEAWPTGRRARLYLSACSDGAGGHHLACFSDVGDILFSTRLPARGHDVAVSPMGTDVVVFARRPGDWFAVIDRQSGACRTVIRSAPGRHFYGHGVFSADGRLLFATENDIATGAGVLGLYDAHARYRRVDERPSHGIGPHDAALQATGGGLVVANGGLRTEPEQGRRILNLDSPQSRLSIVDAQTGALRDEMDLGADLNTLSIRHLALRDDGLIAFGCQHVGDPLDAPPLVGIRTGDGRCHLLEMPDDDLAALDNYIGSVALDAAGRTLCATSPRGGVAVFWDVETRRYRGRIAKPDVCGVAQTRDDATFILTSGNDGACLIDRTLVPRRLEARMQDWIWDNHAISL